MSDRVELYQVGEVQISFFLHLGVSQHFDITSKLYVLLFNIWAQHSIKEI